MLRWVKQWDKAVFGIEPPVAHQQQQRRFQKQQQQQGRFGSKPSVPDKLGRPEKKIMLLCGPPGLGKTTLAHVVAKQCNYNVFEINARYYILYYYITNEHSY